MTSLTGTLALTRFILRRDRIRILVWIAAIVVLAALTAVGIKGLFPTQAALDQTAAATQHNAATIAFNGPAQGLNTVGGQVAFQFGAGGMVLVALMSIFMLGRLTRGEEEAGRLELVRSLPVGIYANTFAAALTVAAMNVAVGTLTAAVLLLQGLPAVGSIVFGVGFILVGFVFGGIALLVAQITENTRVVYGVAGALLGSLVLTTGLVLSTGAPQEAAVAAIAVGVGAAAHGSVGRVSANAVYQFNVTTPITLNITPRVAVTDDMVTCLLKPEIDDVTSTGANNLVSISGPHAATDTYPAGA